ncbi:MULTISPECIES: helix-turn-helix domain-containing protein [unclassified Bradyrhizobium]|nr:MULTISPECIES: helix-turn-helix domain-containing protein [unclassified Bradyrhizobium]
MAQMLGTRSVTERLHSLLIFLSHVYGVKRDGEIVVGMPFTHGDLANLIGSTRQWVTVQLARLQDEGVIRYERSVISILDVSTLGQAMG